MPNQQKDLTTVINSVRYLVVLQARMSSSRLRGKVMMEVNGEPMIYWQIQRVLKSEFVHDLIVATSVDASDDALVDFLISKDIRVFRGSLNNVFERFFQIAEGSPISNIIRLTADCPLVMPKLIDEMIGYFEELKPDYLSNSLVPTFPDGLDIEIFPSKTLRELGQMALSEEELEHVTLGIYRHTEMFRIMNYSSHSDLSSLRWTVDYLEDLIFVRAVYAHFAGRETDFNLDDVLGFCESHPEIRSEIDANRRNEALNEARQEHN
jgi:spore coat polysaccharide biosynthesis protein SpsF